MNFENKIKMKYFLVSIFVLTYYTLSVISSAVLIADFEMTRMIELAAKQPYCRIHTDRGDIQRMVLAADPRRIRQVPQDSVLALEDVCHDSGRSSDEFQGGLGFIYPGTKWCGPGNIATEYSDLGKYTDEDRCCREHDLCPNTLAPGECRRGLCNMGTFTRSHCDCDARFRRCLQSLNSEIANTLGAIFFNVVQVTCFRERSPCSVWQRFGNSIVDTTSNSAEINNCPLEFQTSDIFIPSNDHFISKIANTSNIISFIHKKHDDNSFVARTLKALHGNQERSSNKSYKTEFEQLTNRIGVKLASIGLVTANFLKEMVSWPVKDIFYFIQKVYEQSRGNSISSRSD